MVVIPLCVKTDSSSLSLLRAFSAVSEAIDDDVRDFRVKPSL